MTSFFINKNIKKTDKEMSRLTSKEVRSLAEAYQQVYAPQITEEQIWEEVEDWVNSLLEEGYDLSDYTWEEMYDAYIEEAVGLVGVPKRWYDPLNLRQKALDTMRSGDYPASMSSEQIPKTKSGKVIPRSMSNKKVVDAGTQTAKPAARKDPRDLGGFVPGDDRMPGQKAKPTLIDKSASAPKPSEPRVGSRNKEGKVYTGKNYGYQSWDTAKSKLKMGSEVIGSQPPKGSKPTAAPASRPAAPTPKAAAPTPKAAAPASRPAAPTPKAAAPASRPAAPASRPAAASSAPSAPPAPKVDAPPAPKSSISDTLSDLRAMRQRSAERQKLASHYDPFDVVMGYLLDEGYADTEEAALAIMSNMSEEWKEIIIETMASPNRTKEILS